MSLYRPPFSKVWFRGKMYPINTIVQAVCKVTGDNRYDEVIEDEDDAMAAIEMIVKGDPTRCANFITTLNEGVAR